MVFDKTGTLTEGSFNVTGMFPQDGCTKEKLLRVTAAAEQYSGHPIALSISRAWSEQYAGSLEKPQTVEEIAGKGLHVTLNGNEIYAGNQSLMESIGLTVPVPQEAATVVHTAENGCYLGYILISDVLKPDAVSYTHLRAHET